MYGLPPPMQRPAPSMYPSIRSGAPPDAQGNESFYTGNAAPADSYARPQSYYGGGYQSTPPQPYAQYDKRAPPQQYAPPADQFQQAQQPSHPYPNLSQRPPSTTYQTSSSPQLQRQPSGQHYTPQPSSTYPPQAPPSTVSDAESASFYYGDSNAAQPSAPPVQRTQSFTSQQSQVAQAPPAASPNMYRAQPQQTPLSPHAQPYTNPQSQSSAPVWQQPDATPAPQQQQPQQQYWQQAPPQPQQKKLSGAAAPWQPAPYAAGGYGPESFPSAPQNQLPVQQKVVDEPLIDL